MEENIKRLEVPNLWKIYSEDRKTRIIWICTFSISALLFAYQAYDRFLLILDVPKSAFIKLSFADELAFPAVTICPGYLFRASLFEKRFAPMDKFGCCPSKKTCQWEFIWNMGTVTENIIKECHFRKDWSCMPGAEGKGKWRRLFSSLGRCFTYTSDEFVNCGGDLNALDLAIDPMSWDKSGILLLNGIRVYIHNEDELPLFEVNGINIDEGASTSFALELTQFNRIIDDPKSPCETEPNYNRNVCIMSCINGQAMNLAQVTCKAVFMSDTRYKTCATRKEINALATAYDGIINNGSYWDMCSNVCPEPCQRIVYTPITSSLGFTSSKNESLIKIRIYFRDMWLRTVTEVWDYNFEKFIANVGGSLNLFLGASFITIIQLFDIFMVRCWEKLVTLKRRLGYGGQQRLFERRIKNSKIPVVW